jgi:glutathione peroxidase
MNNFAHSLRLLALVVTGGLAASASAACPELLNHTVEPLTGGKPQSLCQHAGKVVLVVNTASECGYTSQYEGLQALHKKYAAQGLVVLGFPSNAFGGQEPGSNQKIAEFCQANFGVSFPVFAKVEAVPLRRDPVFAGLVRASGAEPRWNFHKYLVDRSGRRVESFESGVEPQSRQLVQRIEALIAQKP